MEDKEATSFQVLADENFQREAVWKTGNSCGAVKLLSPANCKVSRAAYPTRWKRPEVQTPSIVMSQNVKGQSQDIAKG